jgi:DNA mismatch endonuclease (patch repair protein)
MPMAGTTPGPAASSEAVRLRFEGQGRRDTLPELRLRKELHRRGLRYRVDRAVPGLARVRPDLLFAGARVAVFVDGCFWHSCDEHAHLPRSNAAWWIAKLEGNVLRDRRADARLAALGWEVLRVWEHEDPVAAADRVEDLVRSRTPQARTSSSAIS